jgi:lipopolysaccharide/colanic/teichoic acid biosynthesis glycosyltransferase
MSAPSAPTRSNHAEVMAAWREARRTGAHEPLIVEPKRVRYAVAKRCFDFVGAIVLIALLSPVMIGCAVVVKATSPGPILYRSRRCGLGGRTFWFYKFRSMRDGSDRELAKLLALNEKNGPIFKMRHDPRITKVGRFMRRFSLDELPQLFNVVAGQMSLVGPRPPIPHEVEAYDERTLRRLSVLPGMTCYWQIKGRCELSFEEWIELDLQYVDEMSFWLDLKILAMTPVAAVKGIGAY